MFSNLMNTWPNGHRHAMHQSDHEAWNARNYPGTRQLCVECDGETDRCEEDSIHTEEGHGPICLKCWHKTPEYILENSSITGATASGASESSNRPAP